MEFIAKIKIPSINLVETGVPVENPWQGKLSADYFSLSLFIYLWCLQWLVL